MPFCSATDPSPRPWQQGLPEVVYEPPSDAGEEGAEQECAVCLQEYAPGEALRLLPCGHRYHRECIDRCGLVASLLQCRAARQSAAHSSVDDATLVAHGRWLLASAPTASRTLPVCPICKDVPLRERGGDGSAPEGVVVLGRSARCAAAHAPGQRSQASTSAEGEQDAAPPVAALSAEPDARREACAWLAAAEEAGVAEMEMGAAIGGAARVAASV